MGQISLPRLDRVGISMSWESAIATRSDQWLSPKLFIFYRFFTNFLFSFKFHRMIYCWKSASGFNPAGIPFFKKKVKNFNKIVFLKKDKKLIKKNYAHYIYNLNNQYTVLLIYGHLDTKLSYRRKYSHWYH